jgi:hypothetical protein
VTTAVVLGVQGEPGVQGLPDADAAPPSPVGGEDFKEHCEPKESRAEIEALDVRGSSR